MAKDIKIEHQKQLEFAAESFARILIQQASLPKRPDVSNKSENSHGKNKE